MEGAEINSEDDDVMITVKAPSGSMSLTSSLKRGLKLRDQPDTVSLSGALKRGFRKHAIKSVDSAQSLAEPTSPRSTKIFNFRSPKRSKKNLHGDDTISVTSVRASKSELKSYRGSTLRLDDVMPNSAPADDAVSVIEGLLVDTTPIRQQEGIRDTIGRKNVVTLKKMIKLERAQGDKIDAKVLVLTPYRCQILGVKSPFKLEAEFHFLDIKSMDSPSPQRLVISTNHGRIYFMQMIGTDDADHIIGRVALSLRTIFPGVALSRILKASLEPLGRQKVIQNMLNQADQCEPGPCGNFGEMYRCICDYLAAPVREDVEWDVDTIYLSQNCREVNLKDFDLPETKDIIPIITAMIYNRWFEGLVIRNTKLSGEVLEFILKVARNSHNLKELSLEGVGLKGEFAQRLSNNLIENKESCLRVLDLSNNPMEDKGLLHLSGALPLMKHGNLEKLDVARTGLTSKGINGLCQSLRSSPSIMSTLTHLNLSGNSIRSDDAEGLYSFLSTSNQLRHLDISATDCSVEVYVSALAKGGAAHMETVRLGRNHFYGKHISGPIYPHYLEEDLAAIRKNKDNALPPSFQEFFEKTTALKEIDFSHMKVPPEALRCVLEGLLGNGTSGLEVSLNLASCELKSAGCQVIQSTIAPLRNLVALDVADNSLDADVIGLLAWIQKNKSLRELSVGRNFFGMKSKHIRGVMEAAVELVQEEDSQLESLSLAESKIREPLNTLLGCVGSNTSLTTLDISGNFMGDVGSRVLAKSLQINARLKVLKLDRNNLSAVGFHEIANAMEKNYTLRFMPYPVNDAVSAMKHHPERTQAALARIQDLLLRNANSNKSSNEQQFRLQKVVANTAQQVLDKVTEKVDDAINALEILDADSAANSAVVEAKNLVKDAKNSKELLSDIYGLGMERTSGLDSQLQCKINDAASQMDSMVSQHIKDTMASMLRSAEGQCPHMFQELEEELRSSVEEGRRLPEHCIRDHVVKTSGTEIVNKVSELNLSIATMISDKVTDSLLAALSQTNLILTEELHKHKQQQKVGSKENLVADADEPPIADDVGGQGDLLPNMRKERAQSVAKRRQRPVTAQLFEDASKRAPRKQRVTSEVVKITEFGVEEAGDEHEENNKIDEEEVQNVEEAQVPDEASDVIADATDFPEEVEHVKLDHVTKARPRGPTRRHQRRNPAKRSSEVAKQQDVDDFFSNNVSNTNFNEVPTIDEEEEIKRKERLDEKMKSKKLPGMGLPLLTPAMLKTKKKEDSPKDDDAKEADAEEVEEEDRAPPRRPKGAMVMPGMGFGGGLLAEMKLKKLNKKAEDSDGKDPETEKPSPSADKDAGNSPKLESANQNNSNNLGSSPTKGAFLPRSNPEKVKPLMPAAANKPFVNKGKPPPLPNKPKPALHRLGKEGKSRPVSEFLAPSPPSSSLVRTRAASWGKKDGKGNA